MKHITVRIVRCHIFFSKVENNVYFHVQGTGMYKHHITSEESCVYEFNLI